MPPIRFSVIAAALLWLAVSLCGCRNDGSFYIRVLTPDKKPVAGAQLSGGFDWDIFGDQTDDAGFAHIPNWANGWDATITKDNFYTIRGEVSPRMRFTLKPTPESLRLIGEALGTAVYFGTETLVTVDHQGQYRVYTYNDEQVTLIDSTRLPSPAKHFLLHGDTLWYATHDSGLFSFSLRDLRHPEQLRHIAIYGYTGPFLVIDSFVVMGNQWDAGPLMVYKIESESLAAELASVGSQYVKKIAQISHYVVTLGSGQDLPVIFDVADISHPQEVYHGAQADFWTGTVFKNYVILSGADWTANGDSTLYSVLDLADPANPRDLGRFRTDSWIQGIADDSTAVGSYLLAGQSVLKGTIAGGFRSSAIVHHGARYPDLEYGGCSPPYFALNDRLWKLVGSTQP